jgi:hypothetical protein
MGGRSPTAIVRTFIEYVNEADPEGMASLLAEDVAFTDVQGRVFWEKDFMADYVLNYPGYKILVQHILQGAQGAAIVGRTAHSHVPPEIEEREMLVWTAEVRDGLITEWRIYSGEAYADRSWRALAGAPESRRSPQVAEPAALDAEGKEERERAMGFRLSAGRRRRELMPLWWWRVANHNTHDRRFTT